MDLVLQICTVMEKVIISDQRLKKIIDETYKDTDFQVMNKFIEEGWPTDKRKVPDYLKFFYNLRNKITQGRGLLVK